SFRTAWTPAPPVLEDEPDERALDEHEDRTGEDRDPDVRVVDPLRVGRVGRRRRETAVACIGDGRQRQRGAEIKHEDKGFAPPRRWHPMRRGGTVARPPTARGGR